MPRHEVGQIARFVLEYVSDHLFLHSEVYSDVQLMLVEGKTVEAARLIRQLVSENTAMSRAVDLLLANRHLEAERIIQEAMNKEESED